MDDTTDGKWPYDGADEDSRDPDIQELLDQGYGQLDGFVEWLERQMELDTRSAQQDCFNAESYLDYLANNHHKTAEDANEYELRWFVFSHYIRKSLADRETQERLPDSLLRFYQYLSSAHGAILHDWIRAVLEDQQYYLQRTRALQALAGEDEAEWKAGFRDWCAELEDDLDLRCLWLPDDMGEGMTWGEQMGWREATLRDDAIRLWQQERSDMIADGVDLEVIREKLTASYLIWLDTPQDRLEGATPRATVLDERTEQSFNSLDADDGMTDEM